MRIVGGRLRGRPLQAPEGQEVRPTGDRARESLFNLLTHRQFEGVPFPLLPDGLVLDAFAGTGALGLEALSRGARLCHFLEKSPAALTVLRSNVVNLGEADRANVLSGDALRPPHATEAVGLVLMDAPYRTGLTDPALVSLAAAGWVGSETLIIAEIAADETCHHPAFKRLDERRYGVARFLFLQADAS